jgi:hypothetical protein
MGILRSRKFWIFVIVTVVGIELVWFFGANWALGSEWVAAKINSKPEKMQVQWDEARTVIPGFIHLEGLSIRGQSRKQQWYVELTGGRVHMSLLALATKTFKTYSFEGAGLDFRLRKRQLPEDPPLKSAEFAPEIPGLAVDEPPFPPKQKKKKKKSPWKIVLNDVHIDEFEQLWILAMRLTAQGSIDADMSIELGGGALEMKRVRMDLTDAEFAMMGTPVMREMQLGIKARMEPFLPKEAKGLDILKSLTGTVNLSGASKGAALINSLLANIEAVEVGSEGGQIDSSIQIEQGILAPGTEMSFGADGGWVDMMDWRATGQIAVQSEVEQAEEGVSTKVAVTLSDVAVAAQEGGETVLAGADLKLHAGAGELDISGGVEGLASSLEAISLDLTNAYVADITRFPIPAVDDFTLDSGEVLVETHAVLTRENGGEATIDVHGEGIDASYGEVGIKGDLSLDLNVATDDVRDRRFDFTDSGLKIDMVTIEDGKKTDTNWYFHLDMTGGWLHLKDPGEIFCSAEIKMKDTRPLIAILGQKKAIFNKLKGILDFEDLEAEADLELAANRMEIENFDIDSEGLKLKANLQIQDKKASGILYTKFHGIPFALDMRGEKNDLRLRKPLQWYEEQTVPWAGPPIAPQAPASGDAGQ